MIRITYQDGLHQYDKDGRPITTWDDKKCAWIVNPEYEQEKIDWWGENNDFPAGLTFEEFERRNPNWRSIPDIIVTWTWDEESYKKQFPDWYMYDEPSYPVKCTRDWGYMECPEEEAVEMFGRYCSFNHYANNVKVTYNGKVLHDGKLI